MSEFFNAFWPNFVSTVLGVVLAIPPGLWLTRAGERAQRRQERQRLAQALGIVSETLGFNRERFHEASAHVSESKAPFELTADFSAWDAVKSEIIPFLHEPGIQGRLAYHFSRTAAASRLNELYFSYSAGMNSTIMNSPQTRATLRAYLVDVLKQLEQEAGELIAQIRTLRDREA